MTYFKAIFLALFILSCKPNGAVASIKPTHQLWNTLLKKHVSATGHVNYAGFKKDQKQLTTYLKELQTGIPDTSWSKDEQLAYWINAYNAFTIQLILDYADKNISSIKDIGNGIVIPFINSPWDIKFITLGGQKYDLNNIEHGIIRKQFNEPRIHAALVCAAKSCPKLLNEAYTAKLLNQQLDDQMTDFINDKSKNDISPQKIKLSKIFLWYKLDFKDLTETLNTYSKTKIKPGFSKSYLDYNWSLNGSL